MCLAVPGRIIERHEEHGLAIGKVDFSGTVVPVCLAYVPEAQVGAYVIVHAGFALSVIDEEEARKTFELLDEIDRAQAGLPPKAPQ
jgi:hydrogenase expression/formation protein HypC